MATVKYTAERKTVTGVCKKVEYVYKLFQKVEAIKFVWSKMENIVLLKTYSSNKTTFLINIKRMATLFIWFIIIYLCILIRIFEPDDELFISVFFSILVTATF